MKKLNGIIKSCVACLKEFYVPEYRKDKAKYCSVYCQNHGQYNGIVKICKGCKKEFLVSDSRFNKKFCNEKCKNINAATIKEYRRKQKILLSNNRGPHSKLLREKTLKIHSYKCDYCGYNEHNYCLDVHHIDGNPDNNLDNNRSVLCAICHRILHKGGIIYAVEKRKFEKSNK